MSAGVFKLVCVLALVGKGIILYIAVAHPNERVLYVVLGFIALAAVLWVLVENRRFKGPPIGDEIKRRQQLIAEAERAIGETA
jgi:hypothetical protein